MPTRLQKVATRSLHGPVSCWGLSYPWGNREAEARGTGREASIVDIDTKLRKELEDKGKSEAVGGEKEEKRL